RDDASRARPSRRGRGASLRMACDVATFPLRETTTDASPSATADLQVRRSRHSSPLLPCRSRRRVAPPAPPASAAGRAASSPPTPPSAPAGGPPPPAPAAPGGGRPPAAPPPAPRRRHDRAGASPLACPRPPGPRAGFGPVARRSLRRDLLDEIEVTLPRG